jgi:hypothetical protein
LAAALRPGRQVGIGVGFNMLVNVFLRRETGRYRSLVSLLSSKQCNQQLTITPNVLLIFGLPDADIVDAELSWKVQLIPVD